MTTGTQRVRRPWWIPPFLGAIPDVAPEHLRMLGVVSLGLFFDQYDFGMLSAALPRIAADLEISDAQLGYTLSLIRFGAVPAFVVLPLADRIGRRRLFLVAIAVMSIGTGLTALAQSIPQFVAIQMVTRTFMTVGLSLAFVMVTEEFPAQHRGWESACWVRSVRPASDSRQAFSRSSTSCPTAGARFISSGSFR